MKSTNVAQDQARRAAETALRIARDRAQLLESIRTALLAGDNDHALTLMWRYCGLSPAITKDSVK